MRTCLLVGTRGTLLVVRKGVIVGLVLYGLKSVGRASREGRCMRDSSASLAATCWALVIQWACGVVRGLPVLGEVMQDSLV